MKKHLVTLALFASMMSFAQTIKDGIVATDSKRYLKDQKFDGRQHGWFVSGNNSLLFSQSAFSNWVAGGVNSFALNANVDYEFNLTREKHIWDNRIVLGYGIQTNKGESSRKTNDVIDLTSSYGYNIGNNWYLAAAMNFRTQFTEGYDYSLDPKEKISNLMAPGYLSLGLGVDYKPNENFQVNIHPFTPRVTFVLDKDLQQKGNFGLKNDGDNTLFEFGAYLGARYKLQIMDGISYDSRLGIYADYLKKFGNMDVAYQGILDLKVNKFVSAQVAVNLLYDEDQIKKTQVKQTLGIGFNYKFDNTPPKVEEASTTAFIQEAPIFEEKENTIEVATNILKNEPILNETKLVTQ
ncbi:DUF3078 domain-containing protein [Empedobacter stercoris]|uniref:DUF3078 domain-containing protein n=1 Tax=Empedobacter stercoris TaxID=1628248 RepID=UPI001CE1A02E|nr:DUF3078 domain-containing protein [Empedobacter stercoris]MCA4776946.1 DUF3078 domain-containing protein [Empedobacter stercoris]MCA4782406.1 DUF3078 domain-containing protein [Empedobacter stercoris]